MGTAQPQRGMHMLSYAEFVLFEEQTYVAAPLRGMSMGKERRPCPLVKDARR